MRTLLLLLLCTLQHLLAQNATAQVQFSSKQRPYLPSYATEAVAGLAAADVDGDGDVDLVLAAQTVVGLGDQDRLFLNDGAAVFTDVTATHLPAAKDITEQIVLVDIDGDKDFDLVATGERERLYKNDGKGRFTDVTAAQLPQTPEPSTLVVAGDVDGDGDQDLVFANGGLRVQGQLVRLFINDGTGKFTDATSGRLPARTTNSARLLLHDFDGDKDLDLYLANSGKGYFGVEPDDLLYLNDGKGVFQDVSARLPNKHLEAMEAAAIDLDRDGDLDIVASYRTTQNSVKVLVNDGKGNFADSTSTYAPGLPGSVHIAVGDLTGDGSSDVLLADANKLYQNDGKGKLSQANGLPPSIDTIGSVVLADLDGDQMLDIVTGAGNTAHWQWSSNRVFLNVSRANKPAFELIPRFELGAVPVIAWAMATGDVDGDGDLDVLLGDRFYDNKLILGDGNGGFVATDGRIPSHDSSTQDVAFGDMDGDGDLDAYIANGSNLRMQDELWLNDGKGTFTDVTATHVPALSDRAFSVALGDIDGDKDLDVVLGLGEHNPTTNKVFVNDGRGKLSELAGALPPLAGRTRDVHLVDLDGDKDLDLVWADFEANAILINDGKGKFTDVTAQRHPNVPSRRGWNVRPGDVDGDGDVDLFYPSQRQLFLNDGKGFFKDASTRLPATLPSALEVELGDVDEDGDLDIFLGDEGGRLFLNDGTGTFTDATSRVVSDDKTTISFALVDVDRDGDLDAILGRQVYAGDSGPHRVLINHHRDWFAPRVLRPGRGYALRLTAEPGYGSALAIPFLNIAQPATRLRILTFGEFGVALPGLLTLPAMATGANGTAEITLLVPNDPNLVGVSIYSQPLVLHGAASSTWRYANVQADTVR